MKPEQQIPGNDGSGHETCFECHRLTPQTDMVQISGCWVCAGCKPIFLQRFAEGTGLEGMPDVAWRDGGLVVTCIGSELPDRCIKCNRPGNGDKIRRLAYKHTRHAGWLIVSGFILISGLTAFGLPIFILALIPFIVGLSFMKKHARIQYVLCAQHSRRRSIDRAITFGLFMIALVMLLLSISMDSSSGVLLFGVLLMAALIYGAIREPVLTLRRITDDHVWLAGARKQFLESLPEWPGRK